MSDNPYYAAPPPPSGQPYQTQRPGAGMAIAALVLGILALLLSWTILGGVLLGLLAIILGWIASRRARRGLASGRGMAIAGGVLGVVGLLIAVALIAIGVSIFNSPNVQNLRQCLNDAHGDKAKVQQCQNEFRHNVQHNGGSGG
jgi:predicted PurR-regulated permease PerM